MRDTKQGQIGQPEIHQRSRQLLVLGGLHQHQRQRDQPSGKHQQTQLDTTAGSRCACHGHGRSGRDRRSRKKGGPKVSNPNITVMSSGIPAMTTTTSSDVTAVTLVELGHAAV